jgi:hypothetical protein
MRVAFFRAFGVIVLLLDLPLVLISLVEISRAHEMPFPQELSALFFIGFAAIIGVGLLFLRKWAALYFSVRLFWYGLSLMLSSVQPVPFPWNLLCMAEGISLMLPLNVTCRVWSQLSWGGKWFF